MKIAISGSNGFAGSSLTKALEKNGHNITPITREHLSLSVQDFANYLEGTDIIINLAGASISERWSREYKKILYKSRIDTTRKLIEAMASMRKKPKKLLQTSAVGIYDEVGEHTEDDFGYAVDFLGLICRDWEREALRSKELGVETVIFRYGVVLGKNGGALSKMLPAFRLGIAGKIGDGKQPFSWIHIDDLVFVYLRAIEDDSFRGVYNLTAPNPVTNEEFTKTLGAILHRPTLLPLPKFVLAIIYGEGADVLTIGQRVLPKRLLNSGYNFKFPTLKEALEDVL